MPEPIAHRQKAVLLAPEDMRRFSDALAEAYPQARYVMNSRYMRLKGKTPPRLLIGPCMHRIWRYSCRWREPFKMVLDSTWTPMWSWDDFSQKWIYWPARHPQVRFQQIYGPVRHYPNHPQEVQFGTIAVSFNPGFKEQRNWAARFFRLLGKFASNKDLEEVHWPSRKPVEYATGKPLERLGPWRMVGHDARRWALEDPATRVLEYNDWKKTALVPARK